MQKTHQWEIAGEAAWGMVLHREAVIRPLAEHPRSVHKASPQRALEVVQIDHTLVDAIVVHRENRQPIGRPWLTLAVDVKTRMITGFHVSLWPPSALSVCLALTHAVLSKTSALADRELQTLDWPASGLPQVLHVDNAREFHSEALVRGCQEYGIHLDHRLPGQPHFGGHIERLIGTMMGAVHLLPGTTFSDVKQKGCYPSEARAILTISELERWLALQIAGVYHLSPHSSLCTTPLAAWQEAMGRLASPVRKPVDPTEFFLSSFRPYHARCAETSVAGISFFGMRSAVNRGEEVECQALGEVECL